MTSHKSRARDALHETGIDVNDTYRDKQGETNADLIAIAQVHATLELAEQQRIANLIAVFASPGRFGLDYPPVDPRLDQEEDRRQIEARADRVVADVRNGLGLA